MPSLRTNFLGFDLENPWCVASSPASATGKLMARSFEMGWAAAIMKTVCPTEEPIQNVAPRIQAMKKWNREIAFQNIELITDRKLSVWLEELRVLRKRYPTKMIIGSVMAPGGDLEGWGKLVEQMNDVGCDAVELNLGCPHGLPERGMGSICSQDAQLVFEIVSAAKAASKVPILTKLTPNVTNIRPMAKAAQKAGSDAITVINTINGIVGVDVYKKRPHLSVNGFSLIGGISGNAVKPMGLKCVVECKQETGLPISAAGGISSWSDGVEYLLIGAGQLQVCSEIMLRGLKIISSLNKGLEQYLTEMGYSSLGEIDGNVYQQFTSFDHLLRESRNEKVQINHQTCTGCNLCVVACDDTGYSALTLKSQADPSRTQGFHQVAEVILDRCTGCNLCVAVCPVPDCMELQDLGGSFPAALPDEYAKQTL